MFRTKDITSDCFFELKKSIAVLKAPISYKPLKDFLNTFRQIKVVSDLH